MFKPLVLRWMSLTKRWKPYYFMITISQQIHNHRTYPLNKILTGKIVSIVYFLEKMAALSLKGRFLAVSLPITSEARLDLPTKLSDLRSLSIGNKHIQTHDSMYSMYAMYRNMLMPDFCFLSFACPRSPRLKASLPDLIKCWSRRWMIYRAAWSDTFKKTILMLVSIYFTLF